jgi:SPP1 gp7 family putative phage head morphogenesis protein
MPDVQPFAVSPAEAVAFLRDKIDLPTKAWTDLWQGMHSRAFVVAGAQGEKLLADFHAAVNKAISEGTTLAEFRKDFDRIVAAHGWSYRGSRGWRSAVIFNTNLRMAYAAGRWAQIQRVKKQRPYLRYVAVLDDRVRPQHEAWHDTILPVDHEFWRTHFPPNGWNCRCTVQSLNRRDLKRYGLKLSDGPPPTPLVMKSVKTPDGNIMVEVPDGIDPGFAYNVGETAFGRGAQLKALEAHGPWERLSAPGQKIKPLDPLPLDTPAAKTGPFVKPGDETGLRQAFIDALGAEELILEDPLGARINLTLAIVDHMLENAARQDGRERYFPFLKELVTDPAEIWIGWARSGTSGRVSLRRRYVKMIDLGKGHTIGMAADADGRQWSGMTFFRGRASSKSGMRSGLRIFKR